MKQLVLIVNGTEDGEGMVVHHRTSGGTDIFGLGVPNIHSNLDWDLGPTWCYLICAQKTVLIDTGRFGNFDVLKNLLKSVDKEISDLDVVIPTHSHEDHDGNLPEVSFVAKPEIWAHPIYRKMICYHTNIDDGATHPELPGSCRSCILPEKFYRQCLPYHQKRSLLRVDFEIDDSVVSSVDGLRFIFTPGHTPDSTCIVFEDEVIFTGDTVLPDITPHPSRTQVFDYNRRILPERYRRENEVYGLMVYLKSLRKIADMDTGFQATFPAHRLFFKGRFNLIDSARDRAKDIIQFHIDRCRDILEIIKSGPIGVGDIARRHFLPDQLKGYGALMARNEIISHIEIMEECGDVRWVGHE
ncbi:MAG: MBL fold metallo-hydrolase, partial [Chloroflexota bacterium]|nr:MBL fold metallo-hydrolase [Chloroflexota bacterium]